LGVATRRESWSDDRSARSETSHRSETRHLSAPTAHNNPFAHTQLSKSKSSRRLAAAKQCS